MNQKYLWHWFIDTSTYPIDFYVNHSHGQIELYMNEWGTFVVQLWSQYSHKDHKILWSEKWILGSTMILFVNICWFIQYSCTMILKIMIYKQSFSCVINYFSSDSIFTDSTLLCKIIQIIHKIYWRWMIQIIEDEWFKLSMWFIEDEWFRLLIMNDSNYPCDLLKMNDSDYWRRMI
jgi:hypothetical protein